MKRIVFRVLLGLMMCPIVAFSQTVKEITNLTTKNSFAYDIVVADEGGTAVVSYKLAGVSTRVDIEAWSADGSVLLKTNPGTLDPNENRVLFDFAGVADDTEVLFKVKVFSPVVAEPTRIVDENTNNGTWSFYSPFGVTSNNYPYSKTFGRLIVAEARTGTVKNSADAEYQLSHSDKGGIGMGLYSFDPRMQPFVYNDWVDGDWSPRYGAVGGQGMHIDEATGQEYKRVKYSDDGRLFVARQTTERAGVWEFNPENLDHYPLDIFGRGHMRTANGCVYAAAEGNDTDGYTYTNYVSAPASGFDVYGTGENLKIAVAGVKYETVCVSDGGKEAGYGKGEWHEGCRDELDHYYCESAAPLVDKYWTAEGNPAEGGRQWSMMVNVYNLGDPNKSVAYEHQSDNTYWANGHRQWRAGRNEYVAPDIHLPMGIEFCDVRDFNVAFGNDGEDLLLSNTAYVPDVGISNNTTYLRLGIADNMGINTTDFNYKKRRGHYDNNPYGAAIAWNKDRTMVAKALGNGKVGVFNAADVDDFEESDAVYVINPEEGISVNAIAFDYANNIYMVTSDNFENAANQFPVNQYITAGKLVSYALPRSSEEVTTPTLYTYTVKSGPAENVTAKLDKDANGDQDIDVTWDEPAEGEVDNYDVYVKESYIDENGNLVEGDWVLVEGGENITTPNVADPNVGMKEGDDGEKLTTIYEYKVETEFTNGLTDDGENSISNPVVLYENLYISGAATEYGVDGYYLMDKTEDVDGVVTFSAITHFVSADRGFMFPMQERVSPALVAQADNSVATHFTKQPLDINVLGEKDNQFMTESAGVYLVEVVQNENVAILSPYDTTHPYDGQTFVWTETKAGTVELSATFFEEVESFDVSKVHISPENWYSHSGVRELIGLEPEGNTVRFCVNSWDYCLEYNTHYTVTFDEGAVVFKNNSTDDVRALVAVERFSPAFRYSFTTGMLPTSIDDAKAVCTIAFNNNVVTALGVIMVYDLAGVLVAEGEDSVSLADKAQGIYIVRCGDEAMKIVLR